MILKPIVLIVMLLSFNSLVFAQSPSPLGLWLVEEGDALIEIYACGSFLCGKIACVKEPFEADGSVKLDKHNPKPHLRKRPILGLEMLSNFKTTNDANFWEEGKIYDPEEGSTYKSQFTLKHNKLDLRGYIGFSWIGRTTQWTRSNQREQFTCEQS